MAKHEKVQPAPNDSAKQYAPIKWYCDYTVIKLITNSVHHTQSLLRDKQTHSRVFIHWTVAKARSYKRPQAVI